MAICGYSANIDADGKYYQSFGNLKNNTTYYDPMGLKSFNKINSKDSSEIIKKNNPVLKAFNTETGGAGTAGYAMIPVFVDPRIVDQTRKRTPLVTLLPRVTNQGMYAAYNVITAKGGAFTAAEDDALSETNTTYDREAKVIKYLYSVGRVTGPSFAATPGYNIDSITGSNQAVGNAAYGNGNAPNAMQLEVLVKTREIKELEENLIVNGNATSSGITGNPDGTEFDGIVQLQSTTNKVDKNTSALDLSDIDTALQYAFDNGGAPNIAICDSATYTDLLGLLNEKIGYMQAQATTEWGFTAIKLNTMVGQIMIIPSMYLTTTSVSKSMYFLDLSVWEIRVLQDLTYEELAKTNDSRKFMLKMYETLICRNTAFNSWIGEIE
jgi:hypothetical protein